MNSESILGIHALIHQYTCIALNLAFSGFFEGSPSFSISQNIHYYLPMGKIVIKNVWDLDCFYRGKLYSLPLMPLNLKPEKCQIQEGASTTIDFFCSTLRNILMTINPSLNYGDFLFNRLISCLLNIKYRNTISKQPCIDTPWKLISMGCEVNNWNS